MRIRLAAIVTATALAAGLGVTTATSASAETADCGQYSWSQPELSYGDSGDEVKALQCELVNSSFLLDPPITLSIDGQFGKLTLAAVKRFQGCAHLQPDGIVGPLTWKALDYWATPWNGLTC